MVSGLIGNEVPRKGLRVRAPCPPLKPVLCERVFFFLVVYNDSCGFDGDAKLP